MARCSYSGGWRGGGGGGGGGHQTPGNTMVHSSLLLPGPPQHLRLGRQVQK